MEVTSGEMEVDGGLFRICLEGRAGQLPALRANPSSFAGTPCASRPPSFRKNYFTPLEISASTTKKLKNPASPPPVLPWIMFFQNVDAIIGPDEPIVYPEHLTEELDYELELAVVLK